MEKVTVNRYVPGAKVPGSAVLGNTATILLAVAVCTVNRTPPAVTCGLEPKLVPMIVSVLCV